jgi:hypothetical protein
MNRKIAFLSSNSKIDRCAEKEGFVKLLYKQINVKEELGKPVVLFIFKLCL